jgi:hypothetical protein
MVLQDLQVDKVLQELQEVLVDKARLDPQVRLVQERLDLQVRLV